MQPHQTSKISEHLLPSSMSNAHLLYSGVESSSCGKKTNIDDKPLVSAIVATYNRFDYLMNTIDSIKSQTYSNIELIVVNDKSTQPEYYSYDWEKAGVKILHLDKSSKEVIGYPVPGGFQRNAGMKISKGKFIAFCDDDDIWLPNKIELQLQAMNKTGCKMCATEALRGNGVYDPSKKYRLYNKEVFYKTLFKIYENTPFNFSHHGDQLPDVWTEAFFAKHNCAICSGVMLHRDIYESVGDFVPMKAADDYQYWRRAIKKTCCCYVFEPCVYYDAGHGGGINYSWT